MKFKFLNTVLACTFTLITAVANAGFIPAGIQSNLSQQTIENWGWTECHRSGSQSNVSFTNVDTACNGDMMMMAAWDASLGMYGIAAAGATSTVTATQYGNYNDEDALVSHENWSNGVNFYRGTSASWGFTSINSIALHSADINLSNGLNNFSHVGTTTSELDGGEAARGLSWHTGNSALSSGWCYNATGNNQECLYSSGDQRVFFQMDNEPVNVPEPSTLAILALGMIGLASRKQKKQA
jgi:hypothetical protein